MTTPQRGTTVESRLQQLDIQYPLWVFDADQAYWPRKLASILPGSHPAKLLGWSAWLWENGTSMKRSDDKLPPGWHDTQKDDVKSVIPSATIIKQLAWDNRFPMDSLQILYENKDGMKTADLSEDQANWKAIVRIQRKWDGVLLWGRDRGEGVLATPEKLNRYTMHGVAVQVKNDAELFAATGTSVKDGAENIRKAEFELVDTGALVRGVVFPERHHDHDSLFLDGGPDMINNVEALRGTALETASWEDVKAYVRGETQLPLE